MKRGKWTVRLAADPPAGRGLRSADFRLSLWPMASAALERCPSAVNGETLEERIGTPVCQHSVATETLMNSGTLVNSSGPQVPCG